MSRQLMLGMLAFLMLLGGVVTLINVRAQAPKQAQILFTSNREGPDINKKQGLEIFVMDTDGSNQRNLTNNPEQDRNAVWSPDGQKIAFTSDRDGGKYEVYVMDADGKNPRNLTNHPGYDFGPEWSPDGQMIAFFSRRDGNDEIYVMDADGENQRNLTNNFASDTDPTWSPDGRWIVFESERDGNLEIYVMDVDGNNPRNLTNNLLQDWKPAWSPDGQRIAFTRTDTPGGVWDEQSSEIYVMDADGKNQRSLTNNRVEDWFPVWSPDGQKIAFNSWRDGNIEIYVMDADGSTPRRLTNNRAIDGVNDWFDPAFAGVLTPVSPAGKLKGTWGEMRRGR